MAWSHSETHLLYVAEKKRPKAESFFQSKAPELGASDEDTGHPKKEDAPLKVGSPRPGAGSGRRGGRGADRAVPQGEQFAYHEDWGEALSTRSVPVLCALDIEGSSVSVLEGIPEHLSPGQVRMGSSRELEKRGFGGQWWVELPAPASPRRLSGPPVTPVWCLWAGGMSPSAWGCGTAPTAGESPWGTPPHSQTPRPHGDTPLCRQVSTLLRGPDGWEMR